MSTIWNVQGTVSDIPLEKIANFNQFKNIYYHGMAMNAYVMLVKKSRIIYICLFFSSITCFQLITPASFLAHLAKGQVSFCHHLPSVVRLSHIVNFNLLLRNHWANCNQTLVEWYLYGPLPNLCLFIPTSNQDGHQAKNRKKGG